MLEESQDDLLNRMQGIAQVDASICKMLMMACLGMSDGDSAEFLLKRIRDHLAITEDEESMYDPEYYLSYVKDLVELAEGFNHVKPVKYMHENVRDTYEVLLYNKFNLAGILNKLRKQHTKNAMRDNYWMN